jgi:chemotaxis protein MotB
MANDSIIIKKKKVVGGHGHHGGSWKVAYADFVTAMMAFFMVLWIMGMSEESKSSIQGYFHDPVAFMKTSPLSKNVITISASPTSNSKKSVSSGKGLGDHSGLSTTEYDEGSGVKEEIKKQLEGIPNIEKLLKNVEVVSTKEGLRIELLENKGNMFFESGSAKMKPEGKEIVKKLIPVLKNTGRYMVIEGHTDRKPYAGILYTNWELSNERAGALRLQLALFGIPPDRFRGVRAYADTQLRYPGRPFDPRNRRVTILMPWGEKAKEKTKPESDRSEIKKELAIPPVHITGPIEK